MHVLHGKSETVFNCVCCVLEKFNRKCHRRHFDLCCGVCAFFSPPMRDKLRCYDVVINSLS